MESLRKQDKKECEGEEEFARCQSAKESGNVGDLCWEEGCL